MARVLANPVNAYRVGKFEFRIVASDVTPSPEETERLRAQRTEAITRWLLAQWHREQQRRMAKRN